jgi:hypothetical protein
MSNLYSWGQIRLLLQQFAGNGVSLDTIDEKINSRYALILSRMGWQGLEVSGMLQTLAAYTTGTVSVTQGSTAVTGTGTTWVSSMTGLQFVTCFGNPYTVTILTNTTLTLDRPFEGYTNTSLGYWLGRAVYQLPDACRNLKMIRSPWTGVAIPPMDEYEFGQLEGAAIVGGPVQRYIPQPDGVDPATGVTVKQIMLWPLPSVARGYPIVYDSVTEGFDGTSTTNGPLAFVSCAALLAGCKADLALEMRGRMDQAEAFEVLFEKHLMGMVHVENSQKPYPRPRMASQYTRHRMQRVIRGLGDNCFDPIPD